QNFAAHIHGDFAGKVALGYGGCYFGDIAHLVRQIARHGVDAFGEIAPGTGDAAHFRLAAELAFGADFARPAGHFGGEGAELIHHRVDGVLELEDFAAHVDRDLAGEISVGDGGGYFGDVADLRGQVSGHGIDAVREVLPGAGNSTDLRLAAEAAI